MRVAPEPSVAPNECWSIDFVSEALGDGRRFRAFTVIDNFSRPCPVINVAGSLPSSSVVEALENSIAVDGKPSMIRVDNGPEFTSKVFDSWAYAHRIQLDYVTPGKATEDGFIKRFNGNFRDECLSPS